jgi:hypothetical protein
MKRKKSVALGSEYNLPRFLAICALLALSSCGGLLKQSDLESYVETGLSNVLLRSETYSPGSASLGRIPSGTPVTCSLDIINPKSFDITYSLGWNVSDALFTARPSSAPSPTDTAHLSFSFALNNPQAEHTTIVFTLGKYVASINKTYDPETFSVVCDSPPHAATRLSALVDPSGKKSALAILLPKLSSDDDLAQLRISWTKEGESSGDSATYAISSLKTPLSPNPFTGRYDCYFRNADALAGYGYTYSVVVIDQAGQESAPTTVTSKADLYPLNYDANGNTLGSAPAAIGYHYGDTVVVASGAGLQIGGFAFAGWNTAADGSGASYSPGPSFSMPASEVTLYAQYYGALTISFGTTGTMGLAFSPGSATVSRGATVAIACGNPALAAGGSNWRWYKDGALEPAQTGSSYSWTTTTSDSLGQHLISCLVDYGGLSYSGQLRVTIQD